MTSQTGTKIRRKNPYTSDFALWFTGAGTALFFAVSGPATFYIVRPFHDDGTPFGFIAAIALFIALEWGAIGSKLATLWVKDYGITTTLDYICKGLLVLTTLGNLIAADAIFSAAKVTGALQAVQSYPLLYWTACIVYAGIVPILLYQFLRLFVIRFATVRDMNSEKSEAEQQVDQIMLPIRLMTMQYKELMTMMHEVNNAQDTVTVRALPDASPDVYAQLADLRAQLDARRDAQMHEPKPAPVYASVDDARTTVSIDARQIAENVLKLLRDARQPDAQPPMLRIVGADEAPQEDEDQDLLEEELEVQDAVEQALHPDRKYACQQCGEEVTSFRKQQGSRSKGCPQCHPENFQL